MASNASLGAMVAAALALAACDDGSRFPAGSPPGGGPGGMTHRPDAGPDDDAGSSSTISGFVCELADVRALSPCAPVNQAGLQVEIVGTDAKAVTDVQGRFSLPTPAGVGAVVLKVTDPEDGEFHPGATRVVITGGGASNVALRVIDQLLYEEILITTNVAVAPGNGVVVVHVVQGGAPLAGTVVGLLAGLDPFYDTGNPLLFTADPPTIGSGMAMWFDVPPSASSPYLVTVPGVEPIPQATAVAADALLFTTAIVPPP